MNKQVLVEAINKWGVDSQIDIAIEELAELIVALKKLKRAHNKTEGVKARFNVCDEIADVKIVTAQLEMIFDEELIAKREEFKINRLKQRLKG